MLAHPLAKIMPYPLGIIRLAFSSPKDLLITIWQMVLFTIWKLPLVNSGKAGRLEVQPAGIAAVKYGVLAC